MRMRMFLTLFFLLVPLTTFAATVQLPETGQSSCYDSAGNVIFCTGPLGIGQDGAEKSGAVWPGPRFVDNINGTVTDNLTGLIWLKNANCAATLGGVAKTTALTWANAITWSNTLASGSCGLTDGSAAGDWRLPNVKELETLVNAAQVNSATWLKLPAQGFSNVQANFYWSASTYASNPANAWGVGMYDGFVSNDVKTNYSYVWPVRGGQ